MSGASGITGAKVGQRSEFPVTATAPGVRERVEFLKLPANCTKGLEKCPALNDYVMRGILPKEPSDILPWCGSDIEKFKVFRRLLSLCPDEMRQLVRAELKKLPDGALKTLVD